MHPVSELVSLWGILFSFDFMSSLCMTLWKWWLYLLGKIKRGVLFVHPASACIGRDWHSSLFVQRQYVVFCPATS